MSKTWQLRGASGGTGTALPSPVADRKGLDSILLQTVLTLCGSFTAGQRSETEKFYDALRQASRAFGYTTEADHEAQYRIFNSLSVVLCAIESSSLLNAASEENMEMARGLTSASLRVMQTLGPESPCPFGFTRLAEVLGAPLFLCSLLLQRTGYHDQVCKSLAAMQMLEARIGETVDREQPLKQFRSRLARIWKTLPAAEKVRQHA